MSQPSNGGCDFVTTTAGLDGLGSELSRQPSIALDTESDSFHHYPERVCLVQVAAAGHVYLIDPLVVDDMAPLAGLLADNGIEKVMHAASNDVRSLDRQWGFRVRNLFDTSIAASFIGMTRLGLGTVLQETLGVVIPKDKKLQRADWRIRPLPGPTLAYAAADVAHLLGLRQALSKRLSTLGREEWVAEECARVSEIRYTPPDPELAFFSIKGSNDLDSRDLAVLKALSGFREQQALRQGRPHYQIIPDNLLARLAADPRTNLATVAGLGPYGRPPLSQLLRHAIEDGLAGPPINRPSSSALRKTPAVFLRTSDRTRLKALKEWRSALGVKLNLDPALLWPAASLERLAAHPGSLEIESGATEVRGWQRREFGELLGVVLAQLT